MHAWIARWGLVVEQAGFTTIAPDPVVLRTRQLCSRARERGRALQGPIDEGLDAEFARALIGTERTLAARSSRRSHLRARQSGRLALLRQYQRGRGYPRRPAPRVHRRTRSTRPPDTDRDGMPGRLDRGRPGGVEIDSRRQRRAGAVDHR
jgi:hypothetical protein